MELLSYIIIIIVSFFIVKLYYKFFKNIMVGAIIVITGGIKTGKSSLSVYLAKQNYYSALFQYKIKKFFIDLFKIKSNLEMPMFYSNVPIKIKNFCKLKKEHLLRQERFNYKSVVYIQEASLLADSQLIRIPDLNNQLLLFFKLFGHMTKGGKCIMDSQCCQDLHYSIKRILSNYLYINSCTKMPFFLILKVREMMYSEDNTINVFNEDVTETMKTVIVPKSIWKIFDPYAYSILTDNKPINNICSTVKDLKAREIISFRKDFEKEGVKDDE